MKGRPPPSKGQPRSATTRNKTPPPPPNNKNGRNNNIPSNGRAMGNRNLPPENQNGRNKNSPQKGKPEVGSSRPGSMPNNVRPTTQPLPQFIQLFKELTEDQIEALVEKLWPKIEAKIRELNLGGGAGNSGPTVKFTMSGPKPTVPKNENKKGQSQTSDGEKKEGNKPPSGGAKAKKPNFGETLKGKSSVEDIMAVIAENITSPNQEELLEATLEKFNDMDGSALTDLHSKLKDKYGTSSDDSPEKKFLAGLQNAIDQKKPKEDEKAKKAEQSSLNLSELLNTYPLEDNDDTLKKLEDCFALCAGGQDSKEKYLEEAMDRIKTKLETGGMPLSLAKKLRDKLIDNKYLKLFSEKLKEFNNAIIQQKNSIDGIGSILYFIKDELNTAIGAPDAVKTKFEGKLVEIGKKASTITVSTATEVKMDQGDIWRFLEALNDRVNDTSGIKKEVAIQLLGIIKSEHLKDDNATKSHSEAMIEAIGKKFDSVPKSPPKSEDKATEIENVDNYLKSNSLGLENPTQASDIATKICEKFKNSGNKIKADTMKSVILPGVKKRYTELIKSEKYSQKLTELKTCFDTVVAELTKPEHCDGTLDETWTHDAKKGINKAILTRNAKNVENYLNTLDARLNDQSYAEDIAQGICYMLAGKVQAMDYNQLTRAVLPKLKAKFDEFIYENTSDEANIKFCFETIAEKFKIHNRYSDAKKDSDRTRGIWEIGKFETEINAFVISPKVIAIKDFLRDKMSFLSSDAEKFVFDMCELIRNSGSTQSNFKIEYSDLNDIILLALKNFEKDPIKKNQAQFILTVLKEHVEDTVSKPGKDVNACKAEIDKIIDSKFK